MKYLFIIIFSRKGVYIDVHQMLFNIYLAKFRNRRNKSKAISETISQDPKNEFRCPYKFGFLAKRKKDSTVPEDCFYCEKMIECVKA